MTVKVGVTGATGRMGRTLIPLPTPRTFPRPRPMKSRRWYELGLSGGRTPSNGSEYFSLTLPAEEEPPDFGVFQEFAAGTGKGDGAVDHDIADVGEFEALLGVLFDHDDGFALVAL